MKKTIAAAVILWTAVGATATFSQVKMTRDQMMFYTSDWKGDRFPDGRPKVPDDLLKRATDCTIEDIWGFLRQKGYANQFEGDWQALHIDKPFAGRALTAQYMPTRADMAKAIAAEGKAEGRVSGNNSWPINELQIGDKGYDPSAWAQMELTAINAPIRVGRAVVLPGDVVLAKTDGVIFIPAILAEDAVSHAEFTSLEDDYNFELNKEGKNGAEFEGGWTPEKYQGLAKYIDAHPDKLKMPRSEFDALMAERLKRRQAP
jgi:4-hydroxy-4-methyl-2-oxoglutarate aldolase